MFINSDVSILMPNIGLFIITYCIRCTWFPMAAVLMSLRYFYLSLFLIRQHVKMHGRTCMGLSFLFILSFSFLFIFFSLSFIPSPFLLSSFLLSLDIYWKYVYRIDVSVMSVQPVQLLSMIFKSIYSEILDIYRQKKNLVTIDEKPPVVSWEFQIR